MTSPNPFVTLHMRLKTHCHDNFGYYCRKVLILLTLIISRIGRWYAFESKLVYS